MIHSAQSDQNALIFQKVYVASLAMASAAAIQAKPPLHTSTDFPMGVYGRSAIMRDTVVLDIWYAREVGSSERETARMRSGAACPHTERDASAKSKEKKVNPS